MFEDMRNNFFLLWIRCTVVPSLGNWATDLSVELLVDIFTTTLGRCKLFTALHLIVIQFEPAPFVRG